MNVLDAAKLIEPIDQSSIHRAREYQLRLTKPPFALGELEEIANQIAGIQGEAPPHTLKKSALAIFAGDHGVLEEGVSPWPQEVTAQMVQNFLSGGAAANVIARRCGTQVVVVDVGVASDLFDHDGLIKRKIRYGTRNLAISSAMSYDDALDAMQVGFDTALLLKNQGYSILAAGDMGIGNTTPASAIIAQICEVDPRLVTGRGTGIDDETYERKVAAINAGIARLETQANSTDCIGILAELGGYEHAAIVGFLIGGAFSKVPIVLDGLISNAAALVAVALSSNIKEYLFAGHCSREAGAKVALGHLGIRPILNLDMALGEGSGALLALWLIVSAVELMSEMATFDSAGVSETKSK